MIKTVFKDGQSRIAGFFGVYRTFFSGVPETSFSGFLKPRSHASLRAASFLGFRPA
jgi:hypothetical protein